MSSTEFELRAAPTHINKKTNAHNQGTIVFFRVDLKELFGVDINYPGLKSCINKAFMDSKVYCPVATGLMLSSYTLRQLNDHTIECFFDPQKIIGKKRLGHEVKDYYPQYVAESTKNYSFLTKMIYQFYETLFKQVESLRKKEDKKAKIATKNSATMDLAKYLLFSNIDTKYGAIFLNDVRRDYKRRKEEAKDKERIEKENLKKFREAYKAQRKKIKGGRKR